MKKNIFYYTKMLFRSWKNSHSKFNFILKIVFLLLAIGGFSTLVDFSSITVGVSLEVLSGLGLLFVSLFISGYDIYLTLIHDMPSEADITVDVKSARIFPKYWLKDTGIPLDPLRGIMEINIRNSGQEEASIEQWGITDVQFNSPVLENKCTKERFERKIGDGYELIRGQLSVEGEEWIKNLRYTFAINFKDNFPKESLEFAKSLRKNFSTYSFVLRMKYSTMSGKTDYYDIPISGDFREYINTIQNKWEREGKHDLVNLVGKQTEKE